VAGSCGAEEEDAPSTGISTTVENQSSRGSAGCIAGRGEARGEVPQVRAAPMRPETEDLVKKVARSFVKGLRPGSLPLRVFAGRKA
jgi:hypothetical protein